MERYSGLGPFPIFELKRNLPIQMGPIVLKCANDLHGPTLTASLSTRKISNAKSTSHNLRKDNLIFPTIDATPSRLLASEAQRNTGMISMITDSFWSRSTYQTILFRVKLKGVIMLPAAWPGGTRRRICTCSHGSIPPPHASVLRDANNHLPGTSGGSTSRIGTPDQVQNLQLHSRGLKT